MMSAQQVFWSLFTGSISGIVCVLLGSAAIRRDERRRIARAELRRKRRARDLFHGKRTARR